MLFGNLSIQEMLSRAIVLLIAMTVHEFAHNYVAWRMGDPEPARNGRLTLNPLVHINWIGWLMFVLIGFGILGSAPISPYRMPNDNRRWRWLAAVAAGPVSNLILAAVSAIVLRIIGFQTIFTLPDIVQSILLGMVFWNVLLFVFNLIPLFPIDGWHIVLALLPPDLASTWQRHAQTSQIVFIGLIFLSFIPLRGFPDILGTLISQPTYQIYQLLLGG